LRQVLSGYSGFLHQYNWNMIVSGGNHLNPNHYPLFMYDTNLYYILILNQTILIDLYRKMTEQSRPELFDDSETGIAVLWYCTISLSYFIGEMHVIANYLYLACLGWRQNVSIMIIWYYYILNPEDVIIGRLFLLVLPIYYCCYLHRLRRYR
jgi:hypothetical protein